MGGGISQRGRRRRKRKGRLETLEGADYANTDLDVGKMKIKPQKKGAYFSSNAYKSSPVGESCSRQCSGASDPHTVVTLRRAMSTRARSLPPVRVASPTWTGPTSDPVFPGPRRFPRLQPGEGVRALRWTACRGRRRKTQTHGMRRGVSEDHRM